MHSDAVLIRPAAQRDRDFVLDTARRLGGFEPPPHRTREQIVAADAAKLASYFTQLRRLRRRAAAVVRRRPRAELLVAEHAGRPLGYVYLDEARDYFSGRDESYLDVIVVSEEAQGRRIGKALLRAAEDWALGRGHDTISLNVFAANRRARAVYEHLGYALESARYVKQLRPAAHSETRPPSAAGSQERPVARGRTSVAPRGSEWFEDETLWSELHDYIFTPAHFAEAPAEVERVLALVRPAGRAALDLACGPGRLAVELARRGYRVTGLDRTAALLQRARERSIAAQVEIEWVREDMRDFLRPGGFDLVLCMYSSLGYFARRSEDLLVLRNVRESLAPGGAFVVDVSGKECVARAFRPQRSEVRPDGTTLLRRQEILDDWARLREIWTVQRDGAARSYRHEHTLYSGQELRELVLSAGFAEVCLFGGTDGRPYGPDAASLVAVARVR